MLAPTDHVVGAGSVRGAGREAVFAEHQATLRGYCLRLSRGDRFLAEDLAQEAFVRYFARFGDGQQPEHANIAGYLCATARNVFRNELRDRREVADVDVAGRCGADGSLERDPERATLLADQVVQVRRCTARMGERQRRALTLCDVDGQSYAEVGRTLDISTEAAAQLIARGRIRLRRELRCEQVHVARLPRDCRALVDVLLARAEGAPAGGPDPDLERHLQECEPCRTSLAAASEAGSRLRGIAPLPPLGGLLTRIEVFVRDAVQLAPTGLATAVLPAAMLVAGAGGPLLGQHVQTAPPRVAVAAAPGDGGPRSATTRSPASRPPGGAGTGTAATGDPSAGRRLVDDAATVPAPSARPAPVPGVAVGTVGRRTPGDPPAPRPPLPTVGGGIVVARPLVPVTVDPPSGEPATGGSDGGVGERAEPPADAAGVLPDTVELPAAPVGAAQGAVGAVAQTAQGAVTLVDGVVVTTVQGAAAAAGAVVADATDAAAATGQAAVTTVGQVAAPAVTNVGRGGHHGHPACDAGGRNAGAP